MPTLRCQQSARTEWSSFLQRDRFAERPLKTDPAFPKKGDPEAVRQRTHVGPEAEMLESLDAAEIEWLCF